MKIKDLKRIVYIGCDKELRTFKYKVFSEDMIYDFKVVEVSKDNNSPYLITNSSLYNVVYDIDLIKESKILAENISSRHPDKVLCDYLQYDYDKFKKDIYVSIDKQYIMDYLKLGTSEYDVALPIESIYTPNTNWSSSDTILAVLDKEYEYHKDDDYDFIRDIFNNLLDKDKIYIQPFLENLTHHLFYEFLTDEELKLKPTNRPKHFIHMPDKFERKFKSYDDEIEFKRTMEDFEDENYSIEKLEFIIKHNIHYEDPYKDLDSEIVSSASSVMSALAVVTACKKAFNFVKNNDIK